MAGVSRCRRSRRTNELSSGRASRPSGVEAVYGFPVGGLVSSARAGGSLLAEWFWLARPFTLTAAAVPVLFGTALALADGVFRWGPFLAMLVASLLIQAATNMFNEFYDEKRGLDTAESVGIAGSIVGGRMHARAVLLGALLCYVAAAVLGFYLVSVGGWIVLALGLLSALGGYVYSAGPRPIAYTAASEVAVFLFMGVLIVAIAYAVQTVDLSPRVFLAALPIGGPVAAILLANNIRDMESDRRGGRRTVPIVLGRRGGIFFYRALLLEAYAAVAALILLGLVPWSAGLVVLSALLLPGLWRGIAAARVPELLDPVVKRTAGLHASFGLLYCIGVLLGS